MMATGDLVFVVAALVITIIFSALAERAEQTLWRRCRRNPACLRLQRQVTLGKAHCR